MHKVGLTTQTRIRMLLQVDSHAANRTTEMDWFADARLCCVGPAEDNIFFKGTLARTRVVKEQPELPPTKDLLYLTGLEAGEDLTTEGRAKDLLFKYAQRGPKVTEVMLAALLDKVPLKRTDETFLVDVLPHVGDRLLATYSYSKSVPAEGHGEFKAVPVQVSNPSFPHYFQKAPKFSLARLSGIMAKDWLDEVITLKDLVQKDASSQPMEVPVKPIKVAPQPSEEMLKAVPGVWLAFKGLQSLPLKVLALQSGKAIIPNERLQAPAM